jgi:hypothetical protein
LGRLLDIQHIPNLATLIAAFSPILFFLLSNRDTFFYTREKERKELNTILELYNFAKSSEDSYYTTMVKTKLKATLSNLFFKDFNVVIDNNGQAKQLYKLLDFIRPYDIKRLVNSGALELRGQKAFIKKYKKVKSQNLRKLRYQILPCAFLMILFVFVGMYGINTQDGYGKILGGQIAVIGLFFELLLIKAYEQYLSKKKYKGICKKIKLKEYFIK